MLEKKELPQMNELVIATATKVLEHGAYFTLDEYNKLEAYMPIGEVSSTRAFDIKEVIKEGKKYVCKVIRVDQFKKQVDISLKRVSEQEKKEKLISWKRFQRGNKLIEIVAEKAKYDKEKIKEGLYKISEDLLSVFERVAEQGDKALASINIPEEVKKQIVEVAKEHIKIEYAEASAEFTLFTVKPNGINIIKNAIDEAVKQISTSNGLVSYKIFTLGSPRFKLDIKAMDYKVAENIMNAFEKALKNEAVKNNLEFSFKRVYKD
jgi:translation initiation factor 2 subunit 1